MTAEVKVPKLPESVPDAVVAEILAKIGDSVSEGDRLVDLETDKIMLEVPAEVAGVIEDIVIKVGDKVTSDQLMIKMKEGAVAATAPQPTAPATEDTVSVSAQATAGVSPSVRRVLDAHNVSADQVQGTGKNGRLTKGDVEQFVANQTTKSHTAATPTTVSQGQRVERRVPMSRMRARIAERLLDVQQSAAILTTFNEVNMKPVMDIRQAYKTQFEKKYGIRLGFMSFFIKAAVTALKAFPAVNGAIEGEDIIYHEFFDIGVAVSTERGLVVPILRNAEHMSMAEIEMAIRGFAEKAKNNQITLEDMTGGTFSITNGGVFGSMMSTPIINPPQSAILGMHNIVERPIAVNGEVVIAPMMYLALSYDHRIIDGSESVRFLVRLKELLEDPARLLLDI